jgi:hypothetical protein
VSATVQGDFGLHSRSLLQCGPAARSGVSLGAGQHKSVMRNPRKERTAGGLIAPSGKRVLKPSHHLLDHVFYSEGNGSTRSAEH